LGTSGFDPGGNFSITFSKDQFQHGNPDRAAPNVIVRVYDYQNRIVGNSGQFIPLQASHSIDITLYRMPVPDTWNVRGTAYCQDGSVFTQGNIRIYCLHNGQEHWLAETGLGGGAFTLTFSRSQSPTARMEYGFAEFENGKLVKPAWVKTRSRETHGVLESETRWLEKVEYSDGIGNVALAKAKAEPEAGGNERWVGTGRTVLNNKGNPVKQYEPYFSNGEDWENEAGMREQGVTPIMRYDPLSRLVRTDFPDGTHSKVEFTAWEQKDFDRCDTAASSPHFNTPTITHLDSLGRAFLAIADDGKGNHPATKTILDIEGNEKQIIDARGNGTENLQDLNYEYDQMGNIIEIKDDAQKAVFHDNQLVNPSQTFKYDALYRLTEATGREHTDNVADMETLFEGNPNIRESVPQDSSALRNYTRQWEYDEVGNILSLIHTASNGNWNRQYNYAATNNRLLSTTAGNSTADYAYNEHGSMASMPHLQAMDWDFMERLSHITRGTTEAYYSYDGSGQRTRKMVEKNNVVEERLYLGRVV